jgi:hypothetical protein
MRRRNELSNTTDFETKCDILAELWINYKGDPEFQDFIAYNDLGLPLAYAVSTEIVSSTPKAEMLVNETYDLLISGLGLTDDDFQSLNDLLISAGLQDAEE